MAKTVIRHGLDVSLHSLMMHAISVVSCVLSRS